MLFGIGIGDLVKVVRGARALESAPARVTISGAGARDLAEALAFGGDRAAIQVDGDPLRATVAVRLIDGAPSADELATLRRISRAGIPLVVVRTRRAGRIPYVLAADVVEAEAGSTAVDVAAAVARCAGDRAAPLAACLPVLRPHVVRRLIEVTAVTNATIAATGGGERVHLPVLTLAQTRLALLLGLSRGEVLPREPKALGLAAGPAVAGSLGVGLAGRALVRRLPSRGPLVRAAVAYAGTRALGAVRLRV